MTHRHYSITRMAKIIITLCFFVTFIVNSSNAAFNVTTYGAKPDGLSDSTGAFLKAWSLACVAATDATIVVPQGMFLLKVVVFVGPCKSRISIQIFGTIVAPSDFRAIDSQYWILFVKVNNVRLMGGTVDARAAAFWACRKSGQSCPVGARSITFNWANDILISGLTSLNSQLAHIVINSCNNVSVRNVKLIASAKSPNTDGIHVQSSSSVTITGSTIQSGDDCISIGPGTKNLLMSKINCGPGHGVSIGSLGRTAIEEGVENVTLTNSVFIGSDNGVRIKSWARPSNGFVRNVVFQNLIMKNTKNPIIIDQNYCPNNLGCPGQNSGVKISGVTYINIQGTSATERAITFNCSASTPCSGIRLQDIKLTYTNKTALAFCNNIAGTTAGVILPKSCF